jgi:F-type H+-transporting ATPase subunit b
MEAILSTLGLNGPSFLWHLGGFLFLLWLLQMVLFKPVMKMLDDRAARIADSLARADEVRRQSEQAEADRQALLTETRKEAELIRQRADEQAKKILSDIELRAKDSAAQILAQAQQQIETSRQQMIADVRAQVADMVVTAVDQVTRRAVDGTAQRQLIEQFLSDGGSLTASRN